MLTQENQKEDPIKSLHHTIVHTRKVQHQLEFLEEMLQLTHQLGAQMISFKIKQVE